jgi:proteasome lid subunit RPN8/RPN11
MAEERALIVLKESVPVIAAWSRLAAPREACGLIVWHRTSGHHMFTLADNVAEGDHNYAVDPDHQLRHHTADWCEVDGVWHSHPRSSSRLSEVDVAGAIPGMLYLVHSVTWRNIECWTVDNGEARPVPIVIL